MIRSLMLAYSFYYPLTMSLFWIVGGLVYYLHWERKTGRHADPPILSHWPRATVVVPCHNEGAQVRETDSPLAARLVQIARDGAEAIEIEVHRSLPPVLKELRTQGYQLVGLEQTTNSHNLHSFTFERRTILVVGNERAGLADDVLAMLHSVVEIPVYGLPYSYNVATATTMALYEFCRQYPNG